MSFADCLQELREDREITRKELAAALNISVSTLGMYEQGRREPNIDMLIKMADYFNVSLDFMVGRNLSDNSAEEVIKALNLQRQINLLPLEYKKIIRYTLNDKK